MKHTGTGWSLFALAAAVAIPVIIGAQTQELPTGAAAGQQAGTQGKGGKPGGGGGGTILGPLTLGVPADIGCRSTETHGISAVGPLVVGMASGCGNPRSKPFIWSAQTGIAATGSSAGVWASAASDDGIIVGMGPGQEPVIFDEYGGVATVLARPAGYTTGEATNITSDGTAIVGYVYSVSENDNHPFLWRRTSSGWGEGEPIPSGGGWAWGVMRAGDAIRVVGAASYGAWYGAVLWNRTNSGWQHIELNLNSDANAINAAGTVIAGTRYVPLPSDPTTTFPEHVVWEVDPDTGRWRMSTLKGADPNFDEGEASGIADQPDGSTVVVGYSWQNTSGAGGTQWAVAWTRAAGTTGFGSPKLLPPLSKKLGATAAGINSRGEVVGTSPSGTSLYAVMWKLR